MLHRLRTAFAAALGGVLVMTLTVSGVFAARGEGLPSDVGGNFGLGVASWVLSQLDEEEHAEDEQEENSEESEEDDEEEGEEEGDEDEGEEILEQPTDAHGACVSAYAKREVVVESDGNHGSVVSFAARYTCWGLNGPETEEDAEVDESEDEGDVDGSDEELEESDVAPVWSTAVRGKPSWAGNRHNSTADETDGPGKGKASEGKAKAAEAKGKGGKPSWAGGSGKGKARGGR